MTTSHDFKQSFGYIPFCLLLGDPLQLRPRGIGLLTDLIEARKQGLEVHIEQEQGIKLHNTFQEVFLLRGTKRFEDQHLPGLLDCLRNGYQCFVYSRSIPQGAHPDQFGSAEKFFFKRIPYIF